MGPAMSTATDHLVVVAHTLEQGAAWCEATLGVAPGPGGRHPLMGTHNRLLSIAGPAHPNAYLEIIAIDPQAGPPARARWFGMDDPALQAAVRETPRFVHVVARTPQVEMLRWGLVNLGLDPGVPIAAERATPQGRLAWRIMLRDDGRIDRDFALPTLIEWQGRHPAESMPASPVYLRTVQAVGMPERVAALLRWQGLAIDPLHDTPGATPRWQATLQTPAGPVTLASWTPATEP
jgi:hypothetical protein